MKTIRTKKKQPFNRVIHVPGDKSISHRALMLGALAQGTTRIEGFLPGADCMGTISCLQKLGVEIDLYSPTEVEVVGRGNSGLLEPLTSLDVGNSGTTIRLMLGILAGSPFASVILGDESIARRPMKRIVDPLRKMGAQIDGREQGRYPPLFVRGGALQGISPYKSNCRCASQIFSSTRRFASRRRTAVEEARSFSGSYGTNARCLWC